MGLLYDDGNATGKNCPFVNSRKSLVAADDGDAIGGALDLEHCPISADSADVELSTCEYIVHMWVYLLRIRTKG